MDEIGSHSKNRDTNDASFRARKPQVASQSGDKHLGEVHQRKGKGNQIQRGNQFLIGMTGTPKTFRQACLAFVVIDYTNKTTFAPRWESICSKCRKVGNFAVVCRSVREIGVNLEGNSQQFFVGAVNSCDLSKEPWSRGTSPCSSWLIQGLISQYHQNRPITLYLST